NTIVTIDEDKDFELQKDEAKEIMSADTPIRMTKDGEELETRKEVEEELNERMLEGETRLLNRLIKEGKISPDVADQERRRIRKMRSTDQLGKTLLEEDRRSGRGIVQSERRDWNAENMEEILEGVREKDQNLQHPLNQVASFQRKRKQKRVERLAEVA
ncbi:MAG: hypothetical protein U1C97_01285, partial [Candidatus Gracilibacteria bacterium]|nr:hypothetical protein [Candidatus Gracilibacteria bacterium]